MKLDISSLEKALETLETAITQVNGLDTSNPLKTTARDGAIQRFEYTFELSWKMIKRYLEMYMADKADELSAKDLFRRGAEAGLITEPAKWFVFREARNRTTHTYNRAAAEEVYKAAEEFVPHAKELAAKLKEKA
ncbi:MAG TPA: nucleotidyltransferase [bacterium]|nr:nucleotidyltransferase [bacterium]